MKDRVPTYPGRVKLTPVSGQANTYDMERADQPVQEGTPLNKANLLTDETAAKIWPKSDSRPSNPSVNDALKKLATSSTLKVGDMLQSVRTDLGDEWLLCNGQSITQSDYPELYALLMSSVQEQWEDFCEVYSAATSAYIPQNGVVYANGVFAFATKKSSSCYVYYMDAANWGVWSITSYLGGTTANLAWNNGMWTLARSSYFYYGTDISKLAQVYIQETYSYGSVTSAVYYPALNAIALSGSDRSNSYAALGTYKIDTQSVNLQHDLDYYPTGSSTLFQNYLVALVTNDASNYIVVFYDITTSGSIRTAFFVYSVSGYDLNKPFSNIREIASDNAHIAMLKQDGSQLLYGSSIEAGSTDSWQIIKLPKLCSRIWYQDDKWYAAVVIGVTSVLASTIPTSVEIYEFDSFEEILSSDWGGLTYTFTPETNASNLKLSIVPGGPVIRTDQSATDAGNVLFKQYKGIAKALPNISVSGGYQYIKAKEV